MCEKLSFVVKSNTFTLINSHSWKGGWRWSVTSHLSWMILENYYNSMIVYLQKSSGSGVFQVRLDAMCADCNSTFRLCLGHYQAAAATAFISGPPNSSQSAVQPVCSYGTLTAQINAAAAASTSQTIVNFPFEFSWPVSVSTWLKPRKVVCCLRIWHYAENCCWYVATSNDGYWLQLSIGL